MNNFVTVFTHKGLEIQTKNPATPDEIGYRVDHPRFAGMRFRLIQHAVDSIDLLMSDGGEDEADDQTS